MLSFVYLDQTNYEANNQFPIRTIKNFKSKELSPCVWYYGLSRHMVKSFILRPMPDSWWPSSLLSFFPPTPPFTWLLSWACIIIIAWSGWILIRVRMSLQNYRPEPEQQSTSIYCFYHHPLLKGSITFMARQTGSLAGRPAVFSLFQLTVMVVLVDLTR